MEHTCLICTNKFVLKSKRYNRTHLDSNLKTVKKKPTTPRSALELARINITPTKAAYVCDACCKKLHILSKSSHDFEDARKEVFSTIESQSSNYLNSRLVTPEKCN